jgi:WD40 repeat protein
MSVFRVKSVSRCTASLTGTFFLSNFFIKKILLSIGHTEAILSVCFSPNGQQLATGSGDKTVRIWDLNTETPQFTLQGNFHFFFIFFYIKKYKLFFLKKDIPIGYKLYHGPL